MTEHVFDGREIPSDVSDDVAAVARRYEDQYRALIVPRLHAEGTEILGFAPREIADAPGKFSIFFSPRSDVDRVFVAVSAATEQMLELDADLFRNLTTHAEAVGAANDLRLMAINRMVDIGNQFTRQLPSSDPQLPDSALIARFDRTNLVRLLREIGL